MNVLLIGSGGREHALAWAISRSPRLKNLYSAPGNAGFQTVSNLIDLDVTNHDEVLAFCQNYDIGFVVIGPEAPLVAGLSDFLVSHNIPTFGPSQAASRLEGSKSFTKKICKDYKIPTASYGHFNNVSDAIAYIKDNVGPYVIKADGLAAGKGVVIVENPNEAIATVESFLDGQFGNAGQEIVIEEFLEGTEASFFVLCDGETALPIGTAQDHKRAFEGDEGPNTGGMGAFSPSQHIDEAMSEQILETIIRPTLKAMNDQGTPFAGVLYAGLMLTNEGPKLIEYNVRFGDPECQVLMIRLKSDILELLYAAATKDLKGRSVDWRNKAAVTIVVASLGYPGDYTTGDKITGVFDSPQNEDVHIFHAATKLDEDGTLRSNGGRVLNVTATGDDLMAAKDNAYEAMGYVGWVTGFYRRDIGRTIKRETS